MASVDIFCRNVKTILAQRSIRIKDLAERVGLSESYLSLVLNGTRKNLNDEYKDRIASCLNVTISQLYSEEFALQGQRAQPVFLEDPARVEMLRLVDALLSKTGLEDSRPAFLSAIALLGDQDARTVRSFISSLLNNIAKANGKGGQAAALLSLPDPERDLLAVCSVAGNGARQEWVLAASALSGEDFDSLTANLTSKNLLTVTQDTAGRRWRLAVDAPPVSSIFTSRKLREIHHSLAAAMQQYPDEGAAFELSLAQHLSRAGRDSDSFVHLGNAARLQEADKLWDEAAKTWHQASVVCSITGSTSDRSNCLAEAARCLCSAGEYQEANELADYACVMASRNPRAVSNVCVMMGNMLWEHDMGASIAWYRKGIAATPADRPEYGRLLINLAAASLGAGELDQAENALKEASRWTAGRDENEIKLLRFYIELNLGHIEYQRRNWKKARGHFESCLPEAQATGERLDTIWDNLGKLMYRDDDVDLAADYLAKAQGLYLERGYKQFWAGATVELAKVSLRAGDLQAAQGYLDLAKPQLNESTPIEQGWSLLVRGCLEMGKRRANEAAEYGRKSVDAFQREGAERDLAVAALWLSAIFDELGDAQQSQFLQRRAFQIYDKRHWDIRELHRERSLLEPKPK